MEGCDRYKDFVSPNKIQNQIRLVLLVLADTKIGYHNWKMENFVSPNQIKIQIRLVLLVRPDTCDDTSQPCPYGMVQCMDINVTVLFMNLWLKMTCCYCKLIRYCDDY